MASIFLYLHIPFCAHLCAFCAFKVQCYDADLLTSYLQGLKKELMVYISRGETAGYNFKSIYLGGGTPSLMTADQLQALLDFCREQFSLSDPVEISLEATPESPKNTRFFKEWCEPLKFWGAVFSLARTPTIGKPSYG